MVNPRLSPEAGGVKHVRNQNLPNITIGYSRGRLVVLFGAGLLLTLLCAALAFTWQQGKNITTFEVSACYVGAVFFGLATCRMLWTLIFARAPVVFINRVGIRDTRLAGETIAWSAVRKISDRAAIRAEIRGAQGRSARGRAVLRRISVARLVDDEQGARRRRRDRQCGRPDDGRRIIGRDLQAILGRRTTGPCGPAVEEPKAEHSRSLSARARSFRLIPRPRPILRDARLRRALRMRTECAAAVSTDRCRLASS